MLGGDAKTRRLKANEIKDSEEAWSPRESIQL
jgi:hypothetical protein